MGNGSTIDKVTDTGFLELESMASMQRVGEAGITAAFHDGGSTIVDLDGASEEHAKQAAEEHRADIAHGHHTSERYKVVGEIARGGMGAVLEVQDADLDRRVAMKVLLRDTRRSETDSGSPMETGPVNRFIAEAQLTGNLEHPNIVPVHELGLDSDGRVYFTMKRVKGRSLRHIMDKLRQGHPATLAEFTPARLYSILLKICDAIEFAHSRRIVHRDLKPENIMVGQFGEVLVMDWGLAKQIDAPMREAVESANTLPEQRSAAFKLDVSLGVSDGDSGETREGTVSGTPAYMAPEQARGEIRQISPRTDVFCLGGILYEMLCLVPPFLAPRMQEALDQARRHRLLSPKAKLDEVLKDTTLKRAFGEAGIARARKHPRELVSVAMRAMHEEKAKRYPSVADFKRDIENFLSAQPVTAHRDTPFSAMNKWARRNPTRAAVIMLAALFLLLGGVVFAGVQAKAAADRATLAEEARSAEEQQRQEVQRRFKAEAESRKQAEIAKLEAERVAQLEAEKLERERLATEAMAARNAAFTPYSQGSDLRTRASSFADWREKSVLWQQAATHFSRALELDPSFVEAHLELAAVFADLGFDDDALDHYARADALTAATTGRGHVEALMAFAMYDFQRKVLREGMSGNLDEVFRRFRPVQEAAPPDSYYARLAGVLIDLGEAYRTAEGLEFIRARDAAAKRLEEIEREGMPLWEVYTLLAMLDRGEDSRTDRRDYLRRAHELKPNLPILVWLDIRQSGRTSTHQDRNGLRLWDRFIERFPHDPRGYFSRASLRFHSESEHNAQLEIEDLRKAIDINARYADAHKLLLRAYVRDGQFSAAMDHISTMRRNASGLSGASIDLIEAELTASTGDFTRLQRLILNALDANLEDGLQTFAQAVGVLLRDNEFTEMARICQAIEDELADGAPPLVRLFHGRALTMLRDTRSMEMLGMLELDPSSIPREYRPLLAGWADDARRYPEMLESLTSVPTARRRFDLARILALSLASPETWVPLFNADERDASMLTWLNPADYILLAEGYVRWADATTGTRAKGLRAMAVLNLKQAFEEGYLNRAKVLGSPLLAPLTTDPELTKLFDVK